MKTDIQKPDPLEGSAEDQSYTIGKDPVFAGFTIALLIFITLFGVYVLVTSSSPLSAKNLVLLFLQLPIAILVRYKVIYYYYCISEAGLTEFSLFCKKPIRRIPWTDVKQVGYQRGFGRYKTHIVITLSSAPSFQTKIICDSQIYYLVHFPDVIFIKRTEQSVRLCERFYGCFDY